MNKLELIQKEKKLRLKLDSINRLMRSDSEYSRVVMPYYQKAYHKWVMLRNKGVEQGIFDFFVPPAEHKYLKTRS
jgi:hypothetical protein